MRAEEIAELRALEAKAHAAPWEDRSHHDYGWVALYADETTIPEDESLPSMEPGGSSTVHDAALIAAMRNALPELLDAAEERDRLREQIAAATERLATANGWLGSGEVAGALYDLRAALDAPQPTPGRCTCGAGAACSDGSS